MVDEHAEEFAGLPARDYDPEKGIEDAAGSAHRISISYDDAEDGATFTDRLARFLEDPAAGEVKALIIGPWQGDDSSLSSESIIEALVAARETLVNLKALFLGDIISEENEISWIEQSDVTPILNAYPNLQHLRIRGGTNLVLGTVRHPNLLTLTIEAGGLDAGVVRGIAASDLPALEVLELWIGTEGYGRSIGMDDLAPILQGDCLPALRRLGLRNCEGADELAKAVATAPIVSRIEELDLSLGDMGDEGALALAAGPHIAELELLDLHHHYISDDALARLDALGIKVNSEDRKEPYEYGGEQHRYIAASE